MFTPRLQLFALFDRSVCPSPNMSAVPNLPESVPRDDGTNPEAALDHYLAEKAIHGTNGVAGATDSSKTNGINGHTNGAHDVKSSPAWQLHDSPVENQRPMKVIVIGAGYSGVYLGIRIPERMRNCELTIYEKNEGVGGTW